ncbi:hypothetical protein D3C86_1863000 [compost metagenome]
MLHLRKQVPQRIAAAPQGGNLLKQIQVELDHHPLTLRRCQKIMHIPAVDELNFPLLHTDRGIIYSQI